MKKLIVTLVVLVMVNSSIMGCCTLTDSEGVVTKSFSNCLELGAVDYICSGEDGKLTAADMLAVLEFGTTVYAGNPIDIEKAVAALSVVKKTGCFVVAQLKAAFVVVDSINAAKQKKQLGMVKMAPAPLPEYKALRKFVQ
ncbi:MAG: hypothetical protein WC749_02045 [Dehalococcoidia bacterium]